MSNLSISGMSLRDYFASQAPQGIIAGGQNYGTRKAVVCAPYDYTDLMIEKKQKDESKNSKA